MDVEGAVGTAAIVRHNGEVRRRQHGDNQGPVHELVASAAAAVVRGKGQRHGGGGPAANTDVPRAHCAEEFVPPQATITDDVSGLHDLLRIPLGDLLSSNAAQQRPELFEVEVAIVVRIKLLEELLELCGHLHIAIPALQGREKLVLRESRILVLVCNMHQPESLVSRRQLSAVQIPEEKLNLAHLKIARRIFVVMVENLLHVQF
mmetsp:Transcript_86807/g.230654  ORF Transcript_86807/g.230654 Transcript_86807/m.230654 type:complete len:205 (+) Transcript_86807:738-1352(+)